MSAIPSFPYKLLREERPIRSAANLTRHSVEEFLAIAPRVPVRSRIEVYRLEANRVPDRLGSGSVAGAAVLAP